MGSSPYSPDAPRLYRRAVFVPHNLISTQEGPVPLLKFQIVLKLKILMTSGSKNGTQMYFSLKSPGKRTPSRFPKRAPVEREARLRAFTYLSKNSYFCFQKSETRKV